MLFKAAAYIEFLCQLSIFLQPAGGHSIRSGWGIYGKPRRKPLDTGPSLLQFWKEIREKKVNQKAEQTRHCKNVIKSLILSQSKQTDKWPLSRLESQDSRMTWYAKGYYYGTGIPGSQASLWAVLFSFWIKNQTSIKLNLLEKTSIQEHFFWGAVCLFLFQTNRN